MDLKDMQVHACEAAGFLKQLGNESRLMILCALAEGELSVSELNEQVPLSQSALSQHLASLRRSDLVATRREAQNIYYRLQGDRAVRVISLLKELFCPPE